jgi:predicted ATP-dependent endonuclease of OLD family
MIKEIYIDNYKCFQDFRLQLNSDLNVIVGDNESGKSTILEAVSLALTCRLNGRSINYELSPYLFNLSARDKFIDALKNGKHPEPPKIIIELYLVDDKEYARLKGTNNTNREDTSGIKIEISLDDDYKIEYADFISDPSSVSAIPVEYYSVKWKSFANSTVTSRGLPLSATYIDATTIRLYSGADYYIQNAIDESLYPKDKAELAIAYRKLKEEFADKASIKKINNYLKKHKSVISDSSLSVSIDISHKSAWETSLIPYFAELPFQFIGQGEQNIVKTLVALEKKQDRAKVVLLEEPENHLSHSSMSKLISRISAGAKDKQVLLTTHSPYVLNKLGVEKVIMLAKAGWTSLSKLDKDTYRYFKKLPGYDTLRLILSSKAILVEGASDELIVQRAYLDTHKGELPISQGIDVISVNGLSFLRFLAIADQLNILVSVVTDNDGNYDQHIEEKYKDYEQSKAIQVFASKDNSNPSLEDQLAAANDIALLNAVLGTKEKAISDLIAYMKNNKTECALRIFDSSKSIKYPDYIRNAINR